MKNMGCEKLDGIIQFREIYCFAIATGRVQVRDGDKILGSEIIYNYKKEDAIQKIMKRIEVPK